ncbi:MAG: hypothetical protein HGA85_02250 [Nanoarchaeota archaeon]|nr:hypothetical protein [Nanoarchaeota archaeon]
MVFDEAVFPLLSPGYVFEMSSRIRFSPRAVYEVTSFLIEEGIVTEKTSVYDPFCGNGTLLYTLSLLFPDIFHTVIGSDAKPGAVKTTGRNLSLTRTEGLNDEIERLEEKLTRPSSRQISKSDYRRLDALNALKPYIPGHTLGTSMKVFQGNVFRQGYADDYVLPGSVDLVFSDPPYCNACPWYLPDGRAVKSLERQDPFGSLRPYIRNDSKLVLFYEKGAIPRLDGLDVLARKIHHGHAIDREVYICEMKARP